MEPVTFYYFSYNVSHKYFHHNLLSKICLSETELCDMHNSNEIEFFLGDEHKVVSDNFETIESLIDHILEIYTNFIDIDAEIQVCNYIYPPNIIGNRI